MKFQQTLIKGLCLSMSLLLVFKSVTAQLTGIKTIPGSYPTISAAVTALNAAGVGTGGVIFNVAANYTENITTTISLTATGTASDPIVFQKSTSTSGANPLITAYTTGVGTPATAVQDGIFRLVGCDYVTINGIDVRDNPSNTTNPATMEYGYALYKANTANGCQNNVIKNCVITLNRINNANGGGPMVDGSTGIIVTNALATSATTNLLPIAGGTNSNNSFYSNTIQNANNGIALIGYAASSPFTLADNGNDIGGNAAATGNTILNYGGAAGATNAANAVRTLAQQSLNISYNIINSNNGAGINHPNTLRGIYCNTATSASSTISNNTITLKGGGTTQYVAGIENVSGSTAAGNTVAINNNTITNCNYATSTSGGFYGIINNGATPATLTISSNIISNNSNAASISGFLYAICNTGTASSVTISNNTISGNSTALSTGWLNGIYNTAATPILNVTGNNLSANSTASATAQHYAILNTGAVTGAININANTLGTAIAPAVTFTAANSGTQNLIYNNNGTAATTLSISNNNIRQINYAVSGTGSNNFISNTFPTLSQDISNNSFTNIAINTSGNVNFIANNVVVAASGTQNINSNSIVGTFSKTASGGTVTLFNSSAASVAGAVINQNNNNFSNITVTGTTPVAGWVNTDAGAGTKNIQNNIFSNWTSSTGSIVGLNVNCSSSNNAVSGNAINTFNSAAAITGIVAGTGNNKVYGNTINSLFTTGAVAVNGINITTGTSNAVYKNKIYDLQSNSATGTVNGILVSGGTLVNADVYNNLIGDLRTPSTSAADPVRGISINSTAANSTINVYYNTIHLNASSTGTNFGSTGIYHLTNPTATIASLTLRNNIIHNISTPRGTGLTVAYRRSNATLNNYSTASNNNLFYAGAAGATRLLFYDGTNADQTLLAFKARMATRDMASFTEALTSKFLNVSGAAASFLHLDPAIATQAESGAINISGITTDVDADMRFGNAGYTGSGTATDIGADEINGTVLTGLSGNYNVGTAQTYTSLTGASGLFAAINTFGLSGNITINVTSDLAEDGTNSLYKWAETGAGNYTVTIQPSAAAARTISGDVLAGMIRFNGAARVIIDGRFGGAGSYFTFRNLNTSGTTGSTFSFINGASNNTIRYSTIEAYTNATTGVVLFSTSTVAGGNSNNLLDNCAINATVSSNTGNVAIYSAGTVGKENTANTISNSRIYNYRDRAIDITATGSTGWTISGNSLYNGVISGSINYASGSALHGIRISGGSGYAVLNNYIGGTAALATGANALYSSTLGNVSYQGILLTTNNAVPASNIKGNTITAITVTAIPTVAGSYTFTGIQTNGSGINVGGTTAGEGNNIGSNTINSAIVVTTNTASTTFSSYIIGIYSQSAGGVVTGNKIGGIDISNIGTAPASSLFMGIYVNNANAATQVNSNVIGSTGTGAASNSIRVLSTSTATATSLNGIYIGTAVVSAVQVNGNTIQNISHFSTVTTLTPGGFFGIRNTAGGTAAISITNNTIVSNYITAYSSGLFYGIYNAGACTTLAINGNTIAGNSTASTTGVYMAINNSSGVKNSIDINSNNIGTTTLQAVTLTAASAGNHVFIYNNGGAATCNLSISNNIIQGINYAAAGSGSNIYIANYAATLSQNINNNSFTNLTVNTTGSINFIADNVVVPATGSQNINSNAIVGSFSKTGAGGTVTLFNCNAASVGGAVINQNNNNFSNITVTGTTVIAGWINTDAGAGTKTIQNNTFSNWASSTGTITGLNINLSNSTNAVTGNTISNFNSTAAITGVLAGTGNNQLYGNTINSLFTTGAVAVNGININAGTNNAVYKNKIYDLQANNAAGAVNGILVSGTTLVTATIYNNVIGDLRTPATSAADPIRGISVTATSPNSTINVYYNTIHLNASSSGANFGTTGIYHTTSATATIASLVLKNNIIHNISSSNGTGLTVAYRRSNATLANYGAASNNNLFYAGTPGTTKLIYYDGTNADQTITLYKTRVATRDAASVSETLTGKFLSVVGSSAQFLHLDPLQATVAESGGVNIAGITTDIDAQTRQGNAGYTGTGTGTDIGADEFNGITLGPLSGTYNVGTAQTFTNLTGATGLFAAINTRGLAGNVIVNVTSDLAEDGTNSLFKWSETGVGNYTLTIQPNAATVRTISGDVLAGMIRFNNAGKVTIDGRFSGSGKYLTFRNLNTSGTTGTAFTFINGASGNAIRYSNIEAYANATNGAVLFSTSTVAGGNSSNIIDNCSINATVSTNTGNVAIYSAGTVGKENTANTISNNNIYNYRDRAIDITSTGSTGWIISGNSVYNGAVSGSINYAAASALHCIRILGGAGYSLLNNFIGGNAALASGTNAVYASTLGNITYQAILLTTNSAIPASNIKGNTISSIAFASVPTTANSNTFTGIETSGSGINIGGTLANEGNKIGSNTANGAITVSTSTTSTTFTSLIKGINCLSAGGVVIANQVSGIDISNTGTAPAASSFMGIYVNNASAATQVNNNIIGSNGAGAVTNSIRVLSTSAANSSLLTGIAIGGGVVSAVQVNGNRIQNLSHLSTTATVNPGGLIGINSAATGAAAITISGNTIATNYAASFTSGLFYGLYNSGACATVSITGNTISGSTIASATGVYYGIVNTGAVTAAININSNNIGTASSPALTLSIANSGTQTFISNNGGGAASALSISNNIIQGLNYAVAGTGANNYIINNTAVLTRAINSNSFTNMAVNTTGNINFITDNLSVAATGSQNINNNIIAGTFSKTGAGGTVTLFSSTVNSVAGAVINNNNNNFSNITVAGATIIAGWVNTDATAGTKNIQNNIFSSWVGGTGNITGINAGISNSANAVSFNAINNFNSTGNITGIIAGAGNNNVYGNTINSLATTGAAAVTGINVTGGTNNTIYKNKIYDLQSSNAAGTVNGILVSGTITTSTIHNNIIGDLRTPSASAADPVRGISITAASANSTINVYYNTIHLNASSTGTNFGSTGIYHVTNVSATTGTLNLRNNIIHNISSSNGTGLTVAYRRSNTTLTNYGAASNNNLFYAGAPSANKLIFYDGTNADQTIATFKTRVAARETASVTEALLSKFLSVTGSSALFLHINSTLTTAVESGAANIAGITTDFDGQIRQGNAGYTGSDAAPDLGADEIFSLDVIPPVITYTPLTNVTVSTNRTLGGVIITDNGNVNILPGTAPRIYYKRSTDANTWADNTSATNGWKYTETTNTSSPYSFTIDYSLLNGGPAVIGTTIQYFVVAQDMATSANLAINSGTFAATPVSVSLTSAAFPLTGAINSYTVSFGGSVNVGTGEVFTSLTKTGGLFAAINAIGLSANTTVNITSDLAEDGTYALNQWTESGVGNYTLTIQPDAPVNRNIAGDAPSGLIRFNGADRVTIDGNNGGSGNYLDFQNNNTAVATGTAFTFINGAAGNTIKYCTLEAAANGTNGTVLFGTSAVAGGNSNNLIDNCIINATPASNSGNVAIYSAGTVGNENSSNILSNNNIYNFLERGMDITSTGTSNWTITGNNLYNGSVTGAVNYAAGTTLRGIRIAGGSGYTVSNNYIGGSDVLTGGTIATYASTLGSISYKGISLTTSSAIPASNIKGNTIANIAISTVPTAANTAIFSGIETNGSGINIGGSATGEGNIIGSNTINSSLIISTATTSVVNTSLVYGINCNSSNGVITGNQVAGIDISNIGASPAASAFYGIYANNASAPTQINYNSIGSNGAGAVSNSIRVLNASTTTTTALNGITISNTVTTPVQINGNSIQNISNLSTVSSGNFTGISNTATAAGASMTINNNLVNNIGTNSNTSTGSTLYAGIISASPSVISGNTISNILLDAASNTAQVQGISVSGAYAYTISNDTLLNLSTASTKIADVETGAPALFNITGILNSASVAGQIISGNILSGFNSTTTAAGNTAVTGIAISGASAGGIYNNRISAFINTATGTTVLPGISGIMAANGVYNVYNNSISLSNGAYANGIKIYGIHHATSNNWNYFFNSVSTSGNAAGAAARSAAFIRTASGSLMLNNNIFVNTRTGTGANYSISNITSPAATNWTSATSDYNDLYSSNINTVGEWGAATSKTFALWQAASAGETHSVSRAVSFIASPYDLQPDSTTNCNISNGGIPITSPVAITSDLKNVVRSSSTPDIGAYEFSFTGFGLVANSVSPVCEGSLLGLTADAGAAVSPTFSWTNPAKIIVSTSQNPQVTAFAGSYTVTVTDASGCVDSTSTVVSITTRPTGSISGSAVILSGNSATLHIAVTGSGTISGTLSNGDSFSGTAPLIDVLVSPLVTTTFTIASLSDASCSAQAADLTGNAVVTVAASIWNGSVNTDWSLVGNWTGGVPDNTTDAIIPSGTSHNPVVAGTYGINSITILTGADLIINGSGTLQISGNYNNAGTIDNHGTIELNGSAPQNFPGSAATVSAMNNVKVNNAAGVNIDQSFTLTGTLTSTAGTIDLLDKIITLHSDAAYTANVAPVTGDFAYSSGGRFIVERYIPSKRAWRLITAPVTSSNTIYQGWQNGGANTPGLGMLVSGPTGSTYGMDKATATSLETFDVASQAMVAVPSTYVPVSAGNTGSADNTPYFAFIRGDRNLANFTTGNTNITTISSSGKLQTGPQTFPAGNFAGNFALIGNPYASPIDFTNISRTNLMKRFIVWDPSINATGAYVTIDYPLGDAYYTKSVSSSQTNEIQSGQAFFVETYVNGAASLTMGETDKSVTNNTSIFRPMNVIESVSSDLYLLNADNSTHLADGALAEFNDHFTKDVTTEDARKFTNNGETIALKRNGRSLSIEKRPVITSSDTLFLNLSKTTKRAYQLRFNVSTFNNPGLTAVLKDKYLNSSTVLTPGGSNTINFAVDNNAASADASRFMIVFRNSGVLAETITSIKSIKKDKNIQVEWSTVNETGIEKYEVEKSIDGNNFATVNTTVANNNPAVPYSWLDENAVAGSNFYRIKIISPADNASYSAITKVEIGNIKTAFTVFPNPLQGNTIKLQYSNQVAGNYQVSLINNNGQVVYNGKITISSNGSQALRIPQLLAKGLYRVEVKNGEKTLLTQQVIVP